MLTALLLITTLAFCIVVFATLSVNLMQTPDPKPAPPTIPMEAVVSSQIEAIGYDPQSLTLAVRFKNGEGSRTYHYAGVYPAAWQALSSASSVGSHFYKAIKGKYAFTKL